MRLVQIRMRAGMMKNNFAVLLINTVNENPIRLNMTSPFPFVISMQGMIFVFWKQRLFVDDHVGNFAEFIKVQTAFSHQLKLFSESLGKGVLQHRLVVRIIPHEVFPHLIRGIVPLGRYLPPEHSVAFFKSRDSFGVKTLFPRYRVAVRGTDRTFPRLVRLPVIRPLVCRSRSKSKNHLPRRNFTGHVNSQPMAGRHFNRLRNAHRESIA